MGRARGAKVDGCGVDVVVSSRRAEGRRVVESLVTSMVLWCVWCLLIHLVIDSGM